MEKKLPLYKLVLTDEDEGVDFVSLVNKPAIEQDFWVFSKQEPKKFTFVTDAKRRLVTGAIMVADIPIYRINEETQEEFMVQFDKQTIEKVCQKFFRKGLSNNVNIDHSQKVEGVSLYESFITDKSRGIQAPKGYPKVPEGSWFGTYHILNDEVWESVKNGTFKGFSVEGMFKTQLIKMESEDEIDILFKDI